MTEIRDQVRGAAPLIEHKGKKLTANSAGQVGEKKGQDLVHLEPEENTATQVSLNTFSKLLS